MVAREVAATAGVREAAVKAAEEKAAATAVVKVAAVLAEEGRVEAEMQGAALVA